MHGWISRSAAGVELHQLVDGLGRRLSVLEHPEEVLKQHDLAIDDDLSTVWVNGSLREDLEERVADEVGTD